MLNFKKHNLLNALAVASIALVAAILLVPGEVLLRYLGSVSFCTALAVLTAYWASFKITIYKTSPFLSHTDCLVIGIMMTFSVVVIGSFYTAFNGLVLPPLYTPSIYYYEVRAVTLFFFMVGGFMALSARKAIDYMNGTIASRIPGWPRAVLATVAGTILASLSFLIG